MDQNLGKVTIAPNVLVTIVQKTSLSEPGVAKLCDNVPGVKRLLGIHTASQGVAVSVADNLVTVNVHLVARRGPDDQRGLEDQDHPTDQGGLGDRCHLVDRYYDLEDRDHPEDQRGPGGLCHLVPQLVSSCPMAWCRPDQVG